MPSPRPCAEMDDFFAPGPDLEAMDRAELLDYLAAVRQWIARLDQEEPEDMDSEAYDAWGGPPRGPGGSGGRHPGPAG